MPDRSVCTYIDMLNSKRYTYWSTSGSTYQHPEREPSASCLSYLSRSVISLRLAALSLLPPPLSPGVSDCDWLDRVSTPRSSRACESAVGGSSSFLFLLLLLLFCCLSSKLAPVFNPLVLLARTPDVARSKGDPNSQNRFEIVLVPLLNIRKIRRVHDA